MHPVVIVYSINNKQYAILCCTLLETGEDFAISPQHGQTNTQTGRLSPRTLLHNRYMIIRTIGQGGMAAVYQAKDLKQNTPCAIKEMGLSSVPVHEHGQAVQNFLAEATILSRLNHPNLPAFTDFFSTGSRHFLVMEYIEGHTLEELLEHNGGPFSERRVLGWARQLCDVLEYLHSQQPPIIFRDLKPGNMMLRHDGRIKLIDFGIARIFRRSRTHDTQMLGTPGFAPPEQYGASQTDERSDIYSLAMSLFQLMTNTLAEEGFGLLDVRSVNPAISPSVAHALEKATEPNAENRYESIAVFRRALLGVGTFVFEKGNPATTPEELAELCARYPEEAADYLFAGEIEAWLYDIGAPDLARITKRIRVTTGDPELGVEKFLQLVMGPSTSTYSYATGQGRRGTPPGMDSSRSRISRLEDKDGGTDGRKLTSLPAPSVEVRPDTLDFGQVDPGISPPMLIYISGNKGISVRGTIQPVEPWIMVDTQSFDGMSTLVRVRVDSIDLQVVGGRFQVFKRAPLRSARSQPISTHYQGSIIVRPAGEADEYRVPVLLDVLSYKTIGPSGGAQGTISYPSRTLEEDEALVGNSTVMVTRRNTPADLSYQNAKHSEYQAKYGTPDGGNGSASGSWNPARVSAQQHMWLKRGLTFSAAFMAASLSYMFFAHFPSSAQVPPLPPSQGFIAVLLSMIPLATLGALVADRDSTHRKSNALNRFYTGLVITLSTLGLGELVWHMLLGVSAPPLQLCTMLLLTAIGATIGSNSTVSELLIEQSSRAMKYVRPLVIAAA
ncbi:MAG TPA: serine/threonine-protein kinase, partial [Ktedonobacteraceae bacterium]|nr:serine/threonine-protein kinase [Ktedonobacteraceae bacterium]